jgi:formylglycine-generating enzyme required for sulfatase activity
MVFVYFFILFSNGTKIVVFPEEAELDARVKSKFFFDLSLNNSIYSFLASPSFVVNSKGYEEVFGNIAEDEKGKFVKVTMKELPGKLKINVNKENDNTRWFINGEFVSEGKKFEQSLYSGEYEIEIDNPYYQKKKIKTKVVRGEENKINESLEEINGFIELNSDPKDSEIIINGQKIGNTPTIFKNKGGIYKIEIKKKNYNTVIDDVSITNKNKVSKRNYIMDLVEASLKVNVEPSNGVLNINGVVYSSGDLLNLKSNKDYNISYSKSGFKTQFRKVRLEPNEARVEKINLQKEFGLVEVVANPEAEVWLDNKLIGNTPKVLELQTVEHEIEIKKKNFRSVKNKVLPEFSKRKVLNISLIEEKKARLLEAPSEYQNSAGIKLKLFNPEMDMLLLGAERHEKGQRANEITRKVLLEKPFYVSYHEISNKQFSMFNSSKQNDNFPVNNISWFEAATFCNWLSKKENLEEFYIFKKNKLIDFNSSSNGYRLLTEAEWEWLSRKANKKERTIFSWGDSFEIPENYLNIADESTRGTQRNFVKNYNDGSENVSEIGSYDKEISGLYDLSGNLSEWVHDYYTINFSENILKDPMGSKRGSSHVIKGANFSSGTLTKIRSSYRENGINGNDMIGFRIARYL